MPKDLDEELFDKYSNLVLYANKINSLKSVTKGHKQRFINMVLELLKFRGKNMNAQKWIYFTLFYFQKQINKYIKAVDEPVAIKLEQQIKEVVIKKPQEIDYKIENKNTDNINIINKEKVINKEKEKDSKDNEINLDSYKNKNNLNINNEENENKIKKKISQLFEKINKYNSLKEFFSESINQENRSNKIFCEIYQFLNNFDVSSYTNNIEIDNVKINIRQKLINLICLIFPFISGKQKAQIMQKIRAQFESDAIKILMDSKFIEEPKKNGIFEFLVNSIINKEINQENLNIIFYKKLFLNKPDEIFDLYKLYLLISIFQFPHYQEYIDQIAFKIRFVLENYYPLFFDHIKLIYDKIFNILKQLKDFYINGYNNKLYEKENSFEENKGTQIGLDLFSSEENNTYKEVYNNICCFYIIKKNIDLVSGYAKELKNFEFPFNIVELIQIKNNLIKNKFQEYKINLINIETKIYQIGYKSLFPNYNNYNINKNIWPQIPFNNIISKYSINWNFKIVFNSLNYYLHKRLYNYNFILYPYGSSTEFLSDMDSDIDLFLDISKIETKEEKYSFLHNLIYVIKYFDKSVSTTISTRVCVITFNYRGINFDISIVGFSPYLHSVLIREYSLIDPRFPLLLISIKHLIKDLNINNVSEDKNHSFLNSFSWSLLLIAFLQDIVKPPVLPKILSNSEMFTMQGYFGNNKLEKEEEEKNADKNNSDNKFEKVAKIKNFESFVNNMELNDIQIPMGLGDINYRRQNYLKQIKKKNNMTCSELLLEFLEFVIYHFKYDTLFVNCSFEYEGFQNMDVINYFNSEEDYKFLNYFKTKYIKKIKDDKCRDGYFLLRDPFDPRYNPGQTLKASSLKKFFSRLKLAYYHLLKYGNLNLLKKQIEFEDDIKRTNKF